MASRARKSKHGARQEKAGLRLGVAGAVILGALAACCIAVVALCTVWLQDLPDYNDASAYNYAQNIDAVMLVEAFVFRGNRALGYIGTHFIEIDGITVLKVELGKQCRAIVSITASMFWALRARFG